MYRSGWDFYIQSTRKKVTEDFLVVKHELTFIANLSAMNSAQHHDTLWENTLELLFYSLSRNLVAVATMLM